MNLQLGICGLALFMTLTVAKNLPAQTSLETALPAIRQANDPRALAAALAGAAQQNLQLGNSERAAKLIDEAIALCRQHNDKDSLGYMLTIGSQILARLGPDESKAFLTGLLKQEQGNPEIEAVILKTLGDQLVQSGDLVMAMQAFYDHHRHVRDQNPGSEAEAWALLQLGRTCVLGRVFDLGVSALGECKKISLAIGKPEIASYAEAALGNAAMQTGEYQIALNSYASQLAAAKQSNQPHAVQQAASGLVRAHACLNDFASARRLIDQAIQGFPGIQKGAFQNHAATIEAAEGHFDEAIELAQQAIDSKLSQLPPAVRTGYGAQTVMTDNLALASFHLLAGNHAKAKSHADQAELGYQAVLKQLQAITSRGIGSADASRTAVSHIGADLSSIRQQAMVSDEAFEQALLESERGRAQTQAETMRTQFGMAPLADQNGSITLEQIREVAKDQNTTFVEYSVIYQVDQVTRSFLDQDHELNQPSEIYVWVVQPNGQIHFKTIELTERLSELVDSTRNEIRPPTKPKTDSESASDPKSGAVESSAVVESEPAGGDDGREDSGGPAASANPTLGATVAQRSLHDLLIAPIESLLPVDPDDVVAIIPHGSLFAVPFGALPNADQAPLIQRHTLVFSPSIEVHTLACQRVGSAAELNFDDILIVGNPSMPSVQHRPDHPARQLDPLPGSELEAKAIGAMLGVAPLIGAAATEQVVSKQMLLAPVIHLASHGLLESDNVFTQSYLSSIALSPTESDNGFITVEEIMRMKLKADLTVLSACDSGRGRITGDGVVGLSRAYLSAGVPTVIVSLWPVADRPTAFLMVKFYESLRGGQSKAAALRTATLATREKFAAPQLWAPFVIYGSAN